MVRTQFQVENPGMLAKLRHQIADWRVVISFILLAVFLLRCAGELGGEAAARSRGDFDGLFGSVAVLLGAWLRTWSAGVLRKGCDLTTMGPYSLCRHPLYLGSFLMLVGFCHWLGSLAEYVPVVAVIAAVHVITIRNEEVRLAARYGRRWTEYAAATPMLVPFRPGRYAAARWNVRQWMRAREYRALATSIFGLALLSLWR